MKPTDVLEAVAAVTGIEAAAIVAGRGRAAQRARHLAALLMLDARVSERAAHGALGYADLVSLYKARASGRKLVAGPFYAARYREAQSRLAPLAARVWEAA